MGKPGGCHVAVAARVAVAVCRRFRRRLESTPAPVEAAGREGPAAPPPSLPRLPPSPPLAGRVPLAVGAAPGSRGSVGAAWPSSAQPSPGPGRGGWGVWGGFVGRAQEERCQLGKGKVGESQW